MAGLQLLGPEPVAIIRVRLITLAASTLWTVYAIGCLQITPLVIDFFHGDSNKTMFDAMYTERFKPVYLIMPLLTLSSHLVLKMYSNYLKWKVSASMQAFVIFGNNYVATSDVESRFSFSVSSVFVVPFIMLFTFITSLPDRRIRLLVFFPFQICLFTTVLPVWIILTNGQIQRRAKNCILDILENFQNLRRSISKFRSNQVSPA